MRLGEEVFTFLATQKEQVANKRLRVRKAKLTANPASAEAQSRLCRSQKWREGSNEPAQQESVMKCDGPTVRADT
jgi:hypothetical protein